MKKTLVALAVLAASGATFAQATVSGAIAAGYQSTYQDKASSTRAAGDQSGLGFDDSTVTFKVSEDLGGGLKASGELNMTGLTRDSGSNGLRGQNAVLALGSADLGTFAIESRRQALFLSGIANVGGYAQHGRVFADRFTGDQALYTKAFGPVSLTLRHQEEGNLGLGAGAAGLPAKDSVQRNNGVLVNFAQGPLAVAAIYQAYDQKGNVGANFDTVAGIAASYDFGVAKLGAGVKTDKFVTGTGTDTLVGVAVPVGALALNATWASRKTDDFAAAASNGNVQGYTLQAVYSLSKRTSLQANYGTWSKLGQDKNDSNSNLLVVHSF